MMLVIMIMILVTMIMMIDAFIYVIGVAGDFHFELKEVLAGYAPVK